MNVVIVLLSFIASGFSLLGLLWLEAHVKGRLQIALRLAIHVLSVGIFFGFLWYFTSFLVRPCEITHTLAALIFVFVLLGSGLFYYIGRRNI